MAKMVIFVPTYEMVSQAENVIRDLNVDAVVRHVSSDTIVDAAREEQEKGALVAVARGNQAQVLLQESGIPLIEIVMSGQNLARLFDEARKLSEQENPRLALIGFRNMFGDVETLAQVMHLEVQTFFAENRDDIHRCVDEARIWQADVVISGETGLKYAQGLGIKCLFLHSTQDSIETAARLAKRVLYAIELEKIKTAEISSLIDYSFDGVFRLDATGLIVYVNYLVERIFRKDASQLVGKNIRDFLLLDDPDNPLNVAMRNHSNAFGCPVRIRREAVNEQELDADSGPESNQVLMANLAAIDVESQNEGYVLSVQESRRIEELEEQVRKERSLQEKKASHTFADFKTISPLMMEVRDTAMRYARYNHPVLLYGENGTGKRMLAECIYNHSLRADRPFIAVDCGGLSEKMQQQLFLGDGLHRGAFHDAHTATLLIENVDRLSELCQYQLLHALSYGSVVLKEGRAQLAVSIRVICTTSQNLYKQVQNGTFLDELYSRLTQLQVNIPPLSAHREDLPQLLDSFIEKYGMIYRRYITMTQEAKNLIYGWNWFGNTRQFELFCEKMVMIAEDKTITEEFVMKHLPKDLDSEGEPADGSERQPVIIVGDSQGAKIMSALRQHNGNRAAAAEELGISKTTLWRKMKKYGIEKTYR